MSVVSLLLSEGKISQDQLTKAEENKKSSSKDLEDILVELKFIDEQTMADYVMKDMLG